MLSQEQITLYTENLTELTEKCKTEIKIILERGFYNSFEIIGCIRKKSGNTNRLCIFIKCKDCENHYIQRYDAFQNQNMRYPCFWCVRIQHQIDFIINSHIKHNNRYDYSKVEYKKSNMKVIIICKEHGEFSQVPSGHLSGNGCSDCGGSKPLTTETFTIRGNKVHSGRYDYSKVEYKNSNTKVVIICKEHGEFTQTPNGHLSGAGCPECGGNKPLTTEIFIEKSNIKHNNKYDYSKVDYKKSNIKVVIICKDHGEFAQTPSGHLSGDGCPECSSCKPLTTESFIIKSSEVHGDKYNYSKVIYINACSKIIIICKEHGEFTQTPNGHLSGKGCLECGGRVPLTSEIFIDRSTKVHGYKYDYSKVNYININSNIIIICKEHGEFEQAPSNHLAGAGCLECGFKSAADKQRLTLSEFIDRSTNVHDNKYDYSKVEYINNNTKVIIICKKHGEFEQTPGSHLSGAGCLECGFKSAADKQRLTLSEFIDRSTNVHGNKYEYSKVEYINIKTKVIIICKEHGDFTQTPGIHLSGSGCSKCSKAGYSQKQIAWLTKIAEEMNFDIQHAENGGEYTVNLDTPDKYGRNKYKLDGCLLGSKIAFEFDGDFWHGNPLKYNRSDFNTVNDKTYGELFDKTVEKRQVLSQMGWLVFHVWEKESDEGNTYGCKYFKDCLELYSNYPGETKYDDVPTLVYGDYK